MATRVRVSDYIARQLAHHGIRHVFLVTGGGAMHLNDAIGRCDGLSYVCCHHEQAAAMAAESYARMSGRIAAVNVTTGPGGTNALTGVLGAWLDSVGMIVVSGQVKWETLVRSTGLPLRQLGDQECDIVRMVEGITKYAVLVTDPTTIRYHLERAIHLARTGRPGPTWVDVPIDVQGALVDPDTLRGYDPAEDADRDDARPVDTTALDAGLDEAFARLTSAERPVILAGSGVRSSGAHAAFLALVDRLGIPVVTAWNAHDAIWDDHPLYVGRPGSIGDRAGNFAVQNADCLLVLGCRLNIRQVSYNWAAWARAAYKIVVDLDVNELKKPTIRPDLPLHADVRDVIDGLTTRSDAASTPTPERAEARAGWLQWCLERRRRYPVVLPEYRAKPSPVNPYCFVEALFRGLDEDDLVVTGDGTACVVTFQAAHLKPGQRLYTNSGCASMGYDLPAAVGAWFATGGGRHRRIVCLAGDGSIMMNLQELQTIATHRIPVKLFVLDNRGYHSIRQTQANYFPDNIVGCGEESGLSFPDFGRVAAAFGFAHTRCDRHDDLDRAIAETLHGDGPRVCEIALDLDQQFAPKLASRKLDDGRMVSSPLEDLAPFLSREELASNMLVPHLPE